MAKKQKKVGIDQIAKAWVMLVNWLKSLRVAKSSLMHDVRCSNHTIA